ncbi:hypothetical protein AGMMS50212_04810 [Spirochaetia bacterium]|nr:hypothetical protein AGMMS50212_04810 [Spirochaetia bacterium]
MPKVDAPNGFFNPALYANINAKPNKPDKSTKAEGRRKVSFSALFEKKIADDSEAVNESGRRGLTGEETVNNLLDDVHNAGDNLKKRPFPDEIKKYRESIKKFINYVVENGYTVVNDEGIINSQKPKFKKSAARNDPLEGKKRNVFTTVKVIDQKLDKLAADIMMNQNMQIELLARINEINGLLVDMFQ